MNGWDAVMDHCAKLPEWQQYRINQRLLEMLATEQQLLRYGTKYPQDGSIFSIRNTKT